MSDAFVQFE